MNRNALEAAYKTFTDAFCIESKSIKSKLAQILGEVTTNAKLDGIAKVRLDTVECATVEIARPNKSYGHDFTIYFHKDWNTKKITVLLNAGTFGSFGANDQPEINYYIAAGTFAAALPEIQKKVDAIDFTSYYAAQIKMWDAGNALRDFDAAVKKAEYDKKVAEIETKLIVGTKLRIGYNWKKEPIYDMIAHVTSKNILLEKDYGTRTKKTVAVDRILHKKWEFV